MCENIIIKKVSFTGSTPVAKLLYQMAAGTLKKCVVKFYIFIFLDLRIFDLCRVSLEAAFYRFQRREHWRGRWGCVVCLSLCGTKWLQTCLSYIAAIICKFGTSGQTCVCANRIYVHPYLRWICVSTGRQSCQIQSRRWSRGGNMSQNFNIKCQRSSFSVVVEPMDLWSTLVPLKKSHVWGISSGVCIAFGW
jgi:hypothetical protein